MRAFDHSGDLKNKKTRGAKTVFEFFLDAIEKPT